MEGRGYGSLPFARVALAVLAGCTLLPEKQALLDADGDGFDYELDCDDGDAAIGPGLDEVCGDGKVNDCDQDADEAQATCWLQGEVNLGSATAKLSGESNGDNAGMSASEAGDTNGDGLDDILVGALNQDSGGEDAGAVYLLVGGLSGALSLAQATAKLTGEAAGDYAGRSLDAAGDLDQDGYADLIVGAYAADRTDTGALSAGAAYVTLGPVSGQVSLGEADAKLMGELTLDHAGVSVAGAGDADGDGSADVLVGAYNDDFGGTDAGAAYLVHGPPVGYQELTDATLLYGASEEDTAGICVAGDRDIDGDGATDVLVGASDEDTAAENAGALYVLLGPVTADAMNLGDSDARLLGEASRDLAGSSAAMAGDVNADGYEDILAGAPGLNDGSKSDRGAAYLVLGDSRSGLDPNLPLVEADAVMIGANGQDKTGWSVSSAGDVDADGHADLLIGAPAPDDPDYGGRAYLVFGADVEAGTLVADVTFVRYVVGTGAGGAVSAAGDVDSDGFDDVLIGVFWEEGGANAGNEAWLFRGGGY